MEVWQRWGVGGQQVGLRWDGEGSWESGGMP